MTEEEDCAVLIAALRARAPSVTKSIDRAWSRPPALRVIDCILSLNRSYDKFVVKRLDKFEHEYPNVQSISDLQALIDSFPSPHQFMRATLNYDHEERANTLADVVNWLRTIGGTGLMQEQLVRIENWANTSHPSDHASLLIRGFGLAGFQYLRMLFGANTTKPDIHICRFVSSHIGHQVSPIEALRLLETTARAAGVLLRDLDTTIWEERARG